MRPICAVLLAAACGGDDRPGGPVTVGGTDVWVAEAGELQLPIDLGLLEAYAEVGGELEPLAVSIGGGGVATIAAAPDGVYYLRHRGEWIASSRRDLDLTRHRLGRPDVVPAQAVALTVSLSGAAPWQESDLLQLYSAGAALWWLAPVSGAVAGATDVETTFDFVDAEGALPRVEGDPTWAAQLTTRSFAGHDYHAVVAGAVLPTFDLAADPVASVAAILAAPPELVRDLDWRIGAFDAVRLASVPLIGLSFYDLGVAALPLGRSAGHYGPSADLAVMRITDAAGVDLADQIRFANPFPEDWDLIVTAVAWYPKSHRLEEGDAPAILFDALWLRNLLDGPLSSSTIAPELSSPRDLRVDGDAAIDGLRIDGSMPELSWQPPEQGTPGGYEVEVYALTSVAGATRVASRTAVIRTVDTSVRLPPAALVASAGGFVVRVAAVVAGGAQLHETPLALGLPHAWASAQTGVLRR